jgi:hypothetical protein
MASLSQRITGTPQSGFATTEELDDLESLVNTKPNPNLIINGGMDIWQRGTIFASGTFPSGYSADRWKTITGVGVVKSSDVPPQAGCSFSAVATGVGRTANLYTTVELNAAGKASAFTPNSNFTLSFWAKGVAGDPIVTLVAFATSPTSSTDRVSIDINFDVIATGEWQFVERNFNIGSTVPLAGNTNVVVLIRNGTDDSAFSLTAVKLEQGSEATPFTRAGNTLAGELEMCQRYYQSFSSAILCTNSAIPAFNGSVNPVVYLATMRTVPTVVSVTSSGNAPSDAKIQSVKNNTLLVAPNVDWVTGDYTYLNLTLDAEL